MQQNCEVLLAEQAALVAEARLRVGSSTRVWVYRNLVKVRESDGGAGVPPNDAEYGITGD